MADQNTSSNSGSQESPHDSSLELPAEPKLQQTQAPGPLASKVTVSEGRQPLLGGRNRKRLFAINAAVLILIVIIGAVSFLLTNNKSNNPVNNQKTAKYGVTSLPDKNIPANEQLQIGEASQLNINGQVNVGNTLVLTPTAAPAKPVAGQMYFSNSTNQLYVYNGSSFVSLTPGKAASSTTVTTAAGAKSSVLSVQGQTGAVRFSAGGGIALNGTIISNSGVTSLSGTANQVNVSRSTGGVTLSLPQNIAPSSTPTFSGLTLSGLSPNGVLYSNGSKSVSDVAAQFANQCLISGVSAPTWGSCAGAGISGTQGAIAVFTSGTALSSSLLSEDSTSSPTTINDSGNFEITGSGNLKVDNGTITGNGSGLTALNASNVSSGSLALKYGGTGASCANSDSACAATARSNLGAAASGNNSDISQLLAVTKIDNTSASLSVGDVNQTLSLVGSSSSSLAVKGSGGTTTLSFANPSTTASIVVPNASGTVAVQASGPIQLSAGGQISCPNCLVNGTGSGGTPGVVSIDGNPGAITLQGGLGITITDSPGTNSDTITIANAQDISTSAQPTFAGLLLGNKNLGVNNNSPQYPIDVIGDINVDSSSAYLIGGVPICTSGGCTAASGNGNYIQNGTALQTNAAFAIQGAAPGSTVALVKGNAAQSVNIFAVQNSGGTNYLVVSPTGNVGVDNSSPTHPLDVSGDINTTGSLMVGGTAVCSSSSGCTPTSNSPFYIQNGTGTQSNANLNIQSANTNDVGAVIQGAVGGQSVDLFELKASGGSNVFTVSPNGTVYAANELRVGTSPGSTYALEVDGSVNLTSGVNNDFRINGVDICDSTGCIARGGTGTYINNDGTTTQSANFNIQSNINGTTITNSTPTAVIIQASGQTGNLLQLEDSLNNNIFTVAPDGTTSIGGSTGFTSRKLNVNGSIQLPGTGGLFIGGTEVCDSSGCGSAGTPSSSIQNQLSSAQSFNFFISSGATGVDPTAIIQQASGQTGDLLQFEDQGSSVVASFGPSGKLIVGGAGTGSYTGVLNVGTNTTANNGGIYFYTDTNLYRSGAGALKTDGTFQSAEFLQSSLAASTGLLLQSSDSSSNSSKLSFQGVSGTPISLQKQGTVLSVLDGSGNQELGFDTSAAKLLFGNTGDTDLYRSAANALTTDGSLTVAGTFTNTGNTLVKTGTNSTNALTVKNSANSTVLQVDTLDGNGRVGIDTSSAPSFPLDVNGDVNIAAGDAYRIGGSIICQQSGCQSSSTSKFYIQNGIAVQAANFNIKSDVNNTSGLNLGITLATPTTVIQQAEDLSTNLQTGDLLQFKDSNGNKQAAFSADGTQLLLDGASGYVATLTIGTSSDTTAAKGISFGGDTGLYRSAAGQLTIVNEDSSGNITGGGQLVVGGDNALTLGTAGPSGNTGAIVLYGKNNTNTITLKAPDTPDTGGNWTLNIPAITADANICTDNSVCAGYAPSSGGNYIQNNISNPNPQAANFSIMSDVNNTSGQNLNIQLTTPTAVIRQAEDNSSNLQTGDLLQFQNAAGTVVSRFNANGILQGTSGSLTNDPGSDLTLAAGQGTGSAIGGNLVFQVQKPGTAGGSTSLNNLATALTICGGTTVSGVCQNSNAGGAIFQNAADSTNAFTVQNASSANIINVDNTATVNLIPNGGFENNDTNWSGIGGATIQQVTSATTKAWQGNWSLKVQATTGQGVSYAYSSFDNTKWYTFSFYAKADQSNPSMSGISIGHSEGGGGDVICNNGFKFNTGWQRFSCSFQPTTSGAGTLDVILNVTPGTFYIDGAQLEVDQNGTPTVVDSATAFNPGGSLQLEGVIDSPLALQNASNSTNAFQINNATGTNLLNVNTSTTNLGLALLGLNVASPGQVGLSVKGAASQTADLLQLQNSGGTILSEFTSSGALQGGNAVTGGTNDLTGTALTLAGGEGVGKGAGGDINFQIAAPASTSGNTANGLATVLKVSGSNGSAVFQNAVNSTTAFQIQNTSKASLFNVDTTTSKNLIPNGDFEANTTGWKYLKDAASLGSPDTTQAWQGYSSMKIATNSTDGDEAYYGYNLTANAWYTFSFYAKTTGTVSDLSFGHNDNGGADTACKSSQALTTGWQRFSCSFQAASSIVNSYIYIATGSDGETFYVDGLQLELDQNGSPATTDTPSAFNPGGVIQLNGDIGSPVAIQNTSNSTNEFQINNASGYTLLNVNSSTTNNSTPLLTVSPATASKVAVAIKGAASQTGDLLEFQNNSGGILSEFTSSGALQGTNGSGTNVQGGNLNLNGGIGTGLGAGGNIVLSVAAPISPVPSIIVSGLDPVTTKNYVSNPDGMTATNSAIYWTNNGSTSATTNIYTANPDGTSAHILIGSLTGTTNPSGLTTDGTYLYFAVNGSNTIARANIDGTGLNTSFITGTGGGVDDIAIDSTDNKIYFSINSGQIGVAPLSGGATSSTAYINPSANDPNGICGIAYASGTLYFMTHPSGTGQLPTGVYTTPANLANGTATMTALFTGSAYGFTGNKFCGIAVDSTNKVIYWGTTSQTIARAPLPGNSNITFNNAYIPNKVDTIKSGGTNNSKVALNTSGANLFWNNGGNSGTNPNDLTIATATVGGASSSPNALKSVVTVSGGSNGNAGAVSFQNAIDSTNAFQIQNALGNDSLLQVDTVSQYSSTGTTPAFYTGRVGIGTDPTSGLAALNDPNLAQYASLEVDGDVNITGQFLVKGVPLGGSCTSNCTGGQFINNNQGSGSVQMGANFWIQTASANAPTAVLESLGSTQTSNLLEFRDSNGTTVLTSVNKSGAVIDNVTGATALSLTGSTKLDSGTSLFQLGSAITGGSSNGTYIGINNTNGGNAGKADFIDLQDGSGPELTVDYQGNLTTTGIETITGNSASGGALFLNGGSGNKRYGIDFNNDATGNLYLSSAGTLKTDGSLNVGGSLTLGTALSVGSGGTGATTFTKNGILYGNSANAVQVTSIAGAGGGVLYQDGVSSHAPTFLSTLGASNGGTGQSSYATGDLLYASNSTTLSKLADVASGSCLKSGGVGVAPTWGTCITGSFLTKNAQDTSSASVAGYLYGFTNSNATSSAGTLQLNNSGTGNALNIQQSSGNALVIGASKLTVDAASGNVTAGTYNGATLSSTAVDGLNVGSTSVSASAAGTFTIDANTTGQISIGATSTGDILLGGGAGLSKNGCTVTNSSGNFTCDGTLNGLTITSGVIYSPTIKQATGGVGLTLADNGAETGDLLQAKSGSTVLANLDYQGNLTVQGLEVKLNLTVDGHLIGSRDTFGDVSVTLPANQTGPIATVSFTTGYTSTPDVIITPSSQPAGSAQYYACNIGTGSFQICINNLSVAGTYTFNYFVGQQKP